MYQELQGFDEDLVRVQEKWEGFLAGKLEFTRQAGSAKHELARVEASVRLGLGDVPGRTQKEREEKTKAKVLENETYQAALAVLEDAQRSLADMEFNLDVLTRDLARLDRQMRWRERWLGFLSSTRAGAVRKVAVEQEETTGWDKPEIDPSVAPF